MIHAVIPQVRKTPMENPLLYLEIAKKVLTE